MAYLRKYELPKPEKKGNKYIWHPVPKIAKVVPWGYEIDPDDPDVLLPIPEQLELLEEAKAMKKRYSYRELANWLTTITGRSISYIGLMDRMKNERRRKNKAQILRQLEKELTKAIEKAKEIEAKIGGEGTRTPNPDYPGNSQT